MSETEQADQAEQEQSESAWVDPVTGAPMTEEEYNKRLDEFPSEPIFHALNLFDMIKQSFDRNIDAGVLPDTIRDLEATNGRTYAIIESAGLYDNVNDTIVATLVSPFVVLKHGPAERSGKTFEEELVISMQAYYQAATKLLEFPWYKEWKAYREQEFQTRQMLKRLFSDSSLADLGEVLADLGEVSDDEG